MKKSMFVGLSMALLSLVSCTRSQEFDAPVAGMTLIARTEMPAETKTMVEDGTRVYWEPGDEIMVFSGEKSGKFVSDLSASTATATFTGTLGDDAWPEDMDLWAVYPFSEDATFDGETITTTLPSEQIARAGSFGKDMNLAIAHAATQTLQFYNVGGGVRFSVTEEGVKKVMFEGLGGEIISGRVKIGFDESGKPEIQEVSGGSQFITLLPPSGRETFQKDTWYYIVAIPGALEKGYKLRFYKDADYARKVSEKAVQIKRSIYGSIEKADEGIEYEPQTMHFPVTEEEIDNSLDRMEQVGEDAAEIMKNLEQDGIREIEEIATSLEQIDNVLETRINSTGDAVMVMLKDSVWVNFMMEKNEFLEGTPAPPMPRASSPQRKANGVSSGKKAIILLPQFSEFYEELDYLQESLDYAGIDYTNRIYKDSEASVDLFDGGVLDDYDLVYIHTHGCNGYHVKHDDTLVDSWLGLDDSHIRDYLCLLTGTKYKRSLLKDLIKQGKLRWEEACVFYPYGEDPCFAMTPDFLNNASFNQTCVVIGACMSMMEIHGYRYMANKFLTKGAGAYSGFEDSINTYLSPYLNSRLIEFLCHGLSFQDAFDYWKNSVWTTTITEYLWTRIPEEYIVNAQPDLWAYRINDALKDEPFFLVDDAHIELGDPTESDNGYLLTWTCGLSDFKHTQQASYYGKAPFYDETIDAKVSYEVYIDGNPVLSSSTKSATWEQPVVGDHTWYVVANIKEGDTVIASYQSGTGDLIVKDEKTYVIPEIVDLGITVKWASFNLGAAKPEGFGDYFAWGVTDPYYRSLDPLVWKEGKEDGYAWSTYPWCMGSMTTMTKYCTSADYGYNGFVDNKTVLDPEDDAAHVHLGDKWRMPTYSELSELRRNCTWEWATLNGVDGYKVTGPNGNHIFLPLPGYIYKTTLYVPGERGFYECSDLYEDMPCHKRYIVIYEDYFGYGYYRRCEAQSIRPVYDDK